MLIRVGRILRMLGYDTYIRGDETFEEFCSGEGIILTRRRKGIPEDAEGRVLVFGNDLDDLSIVRRIVELFGKPDESLFLTRCLECNSLLETPKDIPEDLNVPLDSLTFCPTCGKYYWEGSHVRRMKKLLKRILE